MSRVRTFVAIDLDSQARKACEQATQRLARLVDGVRWVTNDTMHLTLKFLGDVEDRELHDVCRSANEVAAAFSPFSLRCRGLSAFPTPQKPTTIWMGIEDESNTIVPMQKQLEQLLFDRLGVPAELRTFKPHITLGRNNARGKRLPALSEALVEAAEEDYGTLGVSELVVYSSELTRHGPVYTVLATSPLGGD